jgi:hypothetical protein
MADKTRGDWLDNLVNEWVQQNTNTAAVMVERNVQSLKEANNQ